MKCKTQTLRIIRLSSSAGPLLARVLSCCVMSTESTILKNLPLESIIDSKRLHMEMLHSTYNCGTQPANSATELSSIITLPSPKQHVLSLTSPTKIPSVMPKLGCNNLSYTVATKSPKFYWEIKVTYCLR